MAYAPVGVPVAAVGAYGKGTGKGKFKGGHLPAPPPQPSSLAMKAEARAPMMPSQHLRTATLPQQSLPQQSFPTQPYMGGYAFQYGTTMATSSVALPAPPPTQLQAPLAPQQPVASHPVVLHIYHLSGKRRIKFANRILRMFGTGAYHAAVEVHGVEWSFGAKRLGTGVFACPPGECSAHNYKKPYLMGYTAYSADQVQALVDQMGVSWQGSSYELLTRNCTHFCDEFCQRLGVGKVPPWVTSLAAAGAKLDELRESGHEAKISKGEDPSSTVGDIWEGLAAWGKADRDADVTEKTRCGDFARGCRKCCAC
mmetsp:Transcript_117743/g.305567  ORF Transcript_117743/g.305567 Transcript_117743/m.305567 type:complete len:311 (-) Transcript_117743:62-994(-)